MKAKGVVKGKSIVFQDIPSSEIMREGEEVEVIILPLKKTPHHFATFKLGIKQEFLEREKIYGED